MNDQLLKDLKSNFEFLFNFYYYNCSGLFDVNR
jgi:hypothetical protein